MGTAKDGRQPETHLRSQDWKVMRNTKITAEPHQQLVGDEKCGHHAKLSLAAITLLPFGVRLWERSLQME